MRSNGGIIGAKKSISPSAASGIWSARDVQREVGASNWTYVAIPLAVDYLVVAGGGAGAGHGFLSSDGSNSTFSTVTSVGGGRGGYYSIAGNVGGSGSGGAAGGAPNNAGLVGTANQGYAGGNGAGDDPGYPTGGGGGAGAVGGNATAYPYPNHIYDIAGSGGAGVSVSMVTGTPVTYAGGGGASRPQSYSGGSGGSGGGGAGWISSTGAGAVAGTANTGGGGGGGGYTSCAGAGAGGLRSTVTATGGGGTLESALTLYKLTSYQVTVGAGGTASVGGAPVGANGGSGIVILRYLTADGTITIGAGLTGTTATDGSYKVTTITAGTGNVSWA